MSAQQLCLSCCVEVYSIKDSTLSQQFEIQLNVGNSEAQQQQFLSELDRAKVQTSELYIFFQNKWFPNVTTLFQYKAFISLLLASATISHPKSLLFQFFPRIISYRFFLYNNTRLQLKIDEMKTVRELCYQIAIEHTGLEMEFIDDFSVLIAYKSNKKLWLNPNLSLREQGINLSSNTDNFKLVFARKYYFFEKQILEKQKEQLSKQSVSAFHLTFIQDRKRFLNQEIVEVSFQNNNNNTVTSTEQIPESTIDLSYLLYSLEQLQNTNAETLNWESIIPKSYLSFINALKERFVKKGKPSTTNSRELEFQFVNKLSQQLMYSFELFPAQYNGKEVYLGISSNSITLFDFHTKRPMQLLKPNDILHFFFTHQHFTLVMQNQQQFLFQYETPTYLASRFEDYLKYWKLWGNTLTSTQQNNNNNKDLRIYMREAYEQLYHMERANAPIHLYTNMPTTTGASNSEWTEDALIQKSKLQMEVKALEMQRDALKLKLEASKVGQQKIQEHFVKQYEDDQTQSKFELLKQYHNFLTWEKEKMLKKKNLVKEQEENLIKQKMELAFHQQQLLMNSNSSIPTTARK